MSLPALPVCTCIRCRVIDGGPGTAGARRALSSMLATGGSYLPCRGDVARASRGPRLT